MEEYTMPTIISYAVSNKPIDPRNVIEVITSIKTIYVRLRQFCDRTGLEDPDNDLLGGVALVSVLGMSVIDGYYEDDSESIDLIASANSCYFDLKRPMVSALDGVSRMLRLYDLDYGVDLVEQQVSEYINFVGKDEEIDVERSLELSRMFEDVSWIPKAYVDAYGEDNVLKMIDTVRNLTNRS